MRKQLTWQEEVKAKEELDKLQRVKYGDKPNHRPNNSSNNDDLWSSKKTAKLLKQSEGGTRQDIQLAKALKKYPELAKRGDLFKICKNSCYNAIYFNRNAP